MVDFAVNLPPELRFGKELIHKASRYIFPDLADISWEKSGVPPDTTGTSLVLSKMKRYAERRLKDIIERVSYGKVLFRPRDYRGYEHWLRTGSKEYVKEVLLQGANQNIFDQGYICKILREHMTCHKNHDQLICDILNLHLLLGRFSLCVQE